MKPLILLLCLCGAAFSQVPDNPEPQRQNVHAYVPPKPYSFRETSHRMIRDPWYLTAKGIEIAAIIGDEHDTLRGEAHGCFEQGNQGPYHVSFGRMGSVDWGAFGAFTAVEFFFTKWHFKFAPEAIPLTFAARHAQGMYNWHQTGCL